MGTAVVTGAGQGIGRAISKRLAADGHDIVAVDLNPETAAATADMLGGQWRQCDVSDSESVAALAASLDPVDVLVNNAGIWIFAGMDDMTPADVRRVLEVNVMGVFYCTQALVPLMRSGSAIVNLSSNAAFSNSPGVGIYPPSKAAVESMTQTLARVFCPEVRVLAVAPGMTLTPLAQMWGEEELKKRAQLNAMKRHATPEEVAGAVVGAAADFTFATGNVLLTDGGRWLF